MMAWAAGLFEGEGCIRIWRGKYIRLVMYSTDRDVIEKFHDAVGIGRVRPATKGKSGLGKHKQQWYWECSRFADAQQLLNKLLPYFGQRRSAKAQEALALQLKAKEI